MRFTVNNALFSSAVLTRSCREKKRTTTSFSRRFKEVTREKTFHLHVIAEYAAKQMVIKSYSVTNAIAMVTPISNALSIKLE